MLGGMMHFTFQITRFLLLACTCALLVSTSALAQLTDDPATLPLPDFNVNDPQRAVVISVHFNSAVDVQLNSVIVANTRYPGSVGDPPLILLELLDHQDNVIAKQNAWHPLWIRNWDLGGTESGDVLPAGPGTFFVPLSETLASVRISDIELGQVLLTVDVSAEVLAYCAATPATPISASFLSGFE